MRHPGVATGRSRCLFLVCVLAACDHGDPHAAAPRDTAQPESHTAVSSSATATASAVASVPPPPTDPCAGLPKEGTRRLDPPELKLPSSSPKGEQLYPISEGKPLARVVDACFQSRALAKLRELRPLASPEVAQKLPLRTGDAGAHNRLASASRVSCTAAKQEIFTQAKKNASHAEFLYPWIQAFPASGRADWASATECYRSYAEHFRGYAVYGGLVNGEVVVLEVWLVPEVI